MEGRKVYAFGVKKKKLTVIIIQPHGPTTIGHPHYIFEESQPRKKKEKK